MTALAIRAMTDADHGAVIDLWTAAGLVRPWNDPETDIGFALAQPHATVLVGSDATGIAGSVMAGHDGHRGAIYYLAVRPDRQGQGIGRQMMAAAEDWLRQQGVWKVNLMVRRGNESVLAFYDALQYRPSDVVVLEKWIDETRKFSEKP